VTASNVAGNATATSNASNSVGDGTPRFNAYLNDNSPYNELIATTGMTIQVHTGFVGPQIPTTWTYKWTECYTTWNPDAPQNCRVVNNSTDTYRVGGGVRWGYPLVTGTNAYGSSGQGVAIFEVPFPGDGPPDDSAALLSEYVPQLRYDQLESYHADSAAEATDWSSNQLYVMDGALPESYATPPTLNLGFLGPTYPTGRSAASDDFIEYDDDYQTAYGTLHQDPAYANKAYGRAYTYADGDLALEYWFYYYDNPREHLGIGAHEGDWEGVQIHLDRYENPVTMSFTQHQGGATCDWATQVQHLPDGRPIDYVGRGSHANYPAAGTYSFGLEVGDDYAFGDDPNYVIPDVLDISGSSQPAWMTWPGMWGGSDGAVPSPSGPGVKGEVFDNPLQWDETQGDTHCTPDSPPPGGSAIRSVAGIGVSYPPLPKVTAKLNRAAKRIVVRYSFKSLPANPERKPWAIIVKTVSADPKATPYTTQTLIKRRSGTVLQPLGLGRGPYRLIIGVVSARGTRSPVAHIRVH